jgi:hypothetical protein
MVKGIPENYFLVVEGMIRLVPLEKKIVYRDSYDECFIIEVEEEDIKVDASCRSIFLKTDENTVYFFIEGSKLLANGEGFLMVYE